MKEEEDKNKELRHIIVLRKLFMHMRYFNQFYACDNY